MNRPAATRLKRLLDIVLAAVLICLCLPLLVGVILAILLTAGRPVLYRDTRLGREGRIFTLYKFRSLQVNSADVCTVAPEDDTRLTPLGGWLRRWRLDELPQLFQVLAGSMSLIGPRPLPPGHAATLAGEVRHALLSVRPGLSGAGALAFLAEDAALVGLDDPEKVYLEVILPAKVELELAYIRSWRLRDDIGLMLRTLVQVWSRTVRHQSRVRLRGLIEDAQLSR